MEPVDEGKSEMNQSVEKFKSSFDNISEEYMEILKGNNEELLNKTLQTVYDKVEGDLECLAPKVEEIFNAFRLCPWDNLKVVIIGQDPYPTRGNANGLAFSVRRGVNVPPSLKNIYKALVYSKCVKSHSQLKHGDLTKWAENGVLLLNTALTTEIGQAGAHLEIWEPYINKVIESLCDFAAGEKKKLTFLLWGKKAQQKAEIVNITNTRPPSDRTKHDIKMWGHPSPMNFSNKEGNERNFMNCTHFSECSFIDWNI